MPHYFKWNNPPLNPHKVAFYYLLVIHEVSLFFNFVHKCLVYEVIDCMLCLKYYLLIHVSSPASKPRRLR